jgi:hypothetical protein
VLPLFLLVGSVCNKTKTWLHGRVVRIWNTFFWHLALPLKWIPREGRRVDYLPHTTLHFLLLKKKLREKIKPSYFYIRAATLCDALGVCMCVKPYLSYLGRVLMIILKLLWSAASCERSSWWIPERHKVQNKKWWCYESAADSREWTWLFLTRKRAFGYY